MILLRFLLLFHRALACKLCAVAQGHIHTILRQSRTETEIFLDEPDPTPHGHLKTLHRHVWIHYGTEIILSYFQILMKPFIPEKYTKYREKHSRNL